jgi:hydroxyethylthiazole kinase-like uncharacterized protein yjeF
VSAPAETEVDADLLRSMPLPRPEEAGDKDDRGRVLVLGGSRQAPGGAMLAARAALRAGAGKLKIGVCDSLAEPLAVQIPEALVFGLPQTADGAISPRGAETAAGYAARCDAVIYGPGMIDEEAAAGLLKPLLTMPHPPAFLLDSAALNRLMALTDPLARLGGRAVITPHWGEMATLLDIERAAVAADPLAAARRAADALQVVVALKGAVTHVATPDGRAFIHRHGHKGLATSGSGDVLAGVIGGLLARGADALCAALWGVYAHGQAGGRLGRSVGPLGYLAGEIPGEIPAILGELSA